MLKQWGPILGLILAVTTSALAQKTADPLPHSTPEAQGISSAGISAFLKAVDARRVEPDSRIELHSLMIIRNGHVVAEGWWSPYAREGRHSLYSLSKSFTSTAVGLAIDEGHFSLDDKVISFFPDDLPAKVSDNLAAMRVRDLLTMSVGQESEDRQSDNWVKTFLAIPVKHEPGTVFRYNTSATFMLSAIVQTTTGQTVLEYLTPRLFEPLGINGATWLTSPRGINAGGYGLSIRTEDIARFGLLYLQNGVWNGKQLIPEAWVKEATSAHIASSSSVSEMDDSENDWAQGYGYQFWRTTHGAFRGDGAYGQFAVVLPDLNTVIATTAGSSDMQGVLNLMWEHLYPAIKETALPENETAHMQLEKDLTSLSLLSTEGKTTSPMAAQINGRTYWLEDNPMQIEALSLALQSDGCVLTFRIRTDTGQISCGIGIWKGGTYSLPAPNGSLFSPDSQKLATTGTWIDDHTFEMRLQLVETPFHRTITTRFEDNTVAFTLSGGGRPLTITGRSH